MINKIISVSALTLVIGLWVYSYLQDLQTEERMKSFMNVGPLFSAYDGRDLCETVRMVALHSIGFQQSGLPLPDCEKYLKVTVPAPTQLKIK